MVCVTVKCKGVLIAYINFLIDNIHNAVLNCLSASLKIYGEYTNDSIFYSTLLGAGKSL